MRTTGNVVTNGAANNNHRLQHPEANNVPPPANAFVPDNNPLGNVFKQAIQITAIGFVGLSVRMQLVLGTGGPTEVMDESMGNAVAQALATRGRIRLANYTANDANGNPQITDIIRFTGAVTPNLNPPSFMYLQMTVPGTRSKILGMEDERGGWAVPTPPNEYWRRG